MNSAKIQLSEEELRVALDADFILTKNRIIQKVYELFGMLSHRYRLQAGDVFSFLPVVLPPKIARGENYLGLPYVMLDYPRHFSHTDILAVRTMFWWGNSISLTLHLKGRYKEMFGGAVMRGLVQSQSEGWHFQVGGNEWLHHPTGSTHTLLREADIQTLDSVVETSSFVKLVNFIPLSNWNEAEEILVAKFGQLSSVVSDGLV